jgi:hypothetical protein
MGYLALAQRRLPLKEHHLTLDLHFLYTPSTTVMVEELAVLGLWSHGMVVIGPQTFDDIPMLQGARVEQTRNECRQAFDEPARKTCLVIGIGRSCQKNCLSQNSCSETGKKFYFAGCMNVLL